ncbi:peptidoglycan DD-metalloendopeptidase family protein [Patescibacteria group bacterium]|nr:peptidoglycan DD-metalloendopeptidase family protein [Patescibacteria group bacterium]
MNARSLVYGFLFLALLASMPIGATAQSAAELKDQIEDINRRRAAIDAEIAEYQKQLNVLSGEKQTLQSAIKTLDVSRSQTASQIRSTENKIESANLKLQELAYEIADKETLIAIDRATVAQSLRTIAQMDDLSTFEYLLSSTDLSDAWESVDAARSVNDALRAHAQALSQTKQVLNVQHEEVGATKKDLSSLSVDLNTQKQALDVNRQSKQSLLSQTQSEEAAYQELIAKKRAEQALFESELDRLEQQLTGSVDSSRIPSAGSGVLAWPFSSTYMSNCSSKSSVLGNAYCITQYFGNTAFSTANPQIYNGAGHNAVDFSAPTGTALQAALSGTITDTGNTDAVPGCYSFGKWVLIKHANGLSTLYAHLSSITVSAGQSVSTGQVIGYSGMTGYATGPHLHFGVYASEAVQVMTLAQFRGATSACANAKMPVAPREAYLNPMSYL